MKKLLAIAILGMFLMTSLIGCMEKKSLEIGDIASNPSENPKYKIASFYHLNGLKIEANPLAYELPLNFDHIKNKDMLDLFNLTKNQTKFLEDKGFVILKYGKEDNFSKVYEKLKNMGVPIFITSDTFLHLYHIQFNEILKELEEDEFYEELINLTKAMFEKSKEDYETYDGMVKEAARRNVAYFGVALILLGGKEKIPDYVADEVNKEIDNIEEHSGMKNSSIFHYMEDYSQYVPRGHYTQSEKLQRYFKTMMWYGRMAFFLQKGMVSEEDAKIATMQAILISIDLENTRAGDKTCMEIWDRIYSITSFFVGTADDLTPYEYIEALNKIFDGNFSIATLNESELSKIREELKKMNIPKIYGGSGIISIDPTHPEKWDEMMNETKGMRFMGQRYVPDSYIFQQLVSPLVGMYVGNGKPFTMEYTEGGAARCFPRGLDVMAVLGSDDALDIIEKEGDADYAGENTSYHKQLEMLRREFGNLSIEEWNRNLYFSWLFSLQPLLHGFDESYPVFMRNKEWRYKELQTCLASWTELRHDTILYAKQSYTARLTAMPVKSKGYVEPVPEFYLRLKALVNMTLNGLKSLDALNESQEYRMEKLASILDEALKISIDELEGKSIEQYETFFTGFIDAISDITRGYNREAIKTTMVADVHTDLNTMKCLEEGVGYIDLVIVAYEDNGNIYLSAGPIFSYYEFKQPIDDRLTDEKWEEMGAFSTLAPWQQEIYPK